MNFFLKAQIEFKETHSLTFQEIERNFKELKKENYGTFIYTIFLSFFFLFLILSFLNLGVIVFLGILNSLFSSNKIFFCIRVIFLVTLIRLNGLLFFIPKTQEVKEIKILRCRGFWNDCFWAYFYLRG